MTLHITYLVPDIRTYRDVNRLQYSYNICYISSKNASHGPAPEQKMFRDRSEATLFRPGTVPVPVPVLSLLAINCWQLIVTSVWSAIQHTAIIWLTRRTH